MQSVKSSILPMKLANILPNKQTNKQTNSIQQFPSWKVNTYSAGWEYYPPSGHFLAGLSDLKFVGIFHLYRHATCTAQLMSILNIFLILWNKWPEQYLPYIFQDLNEKALLQRYTYHVPECMKIQSLCRHMSPYVRCDVSARSWMPSCSHLSHLLIMKCR
jgi:hypothetical protein